MRIALLLLCAVVLQAAEFRVGAGLTDHQVFQRGAQNTADIKVGGTADGLAGKPIEARILARTKPVKGWSWKSIATVGGSTWTGALTGVPMGGPYNIEFRSTGATSVVVKDVLVGDLWILAGQSNMEGVGRPRECPGSRSAGPQLRSTRSLAYRRGAPAQLTRRSRSRTLARRSKVRLTGQELETYNKERKKGAGLGLPFAVEMTRRTGVPVGLIPCAHGGTSMAQWDPALKDKGGDSLYGAMIRRFEAIGGKAAGVLWYQGEAEANPQASSVFAGQVHRFRRGGAARFRPAGPALLLRSDRPLCLDRESS